MAMKASSRQIFDFLKEHADEDYTSEDLAKIFGISKRSVDGSFTSAIQRKKNANDEPLGERINAEVELPDGTHRAIKILKLTKAGLEYDPDGDQT